MNSAATLLIMVRSSDAIQILVNIGSDNGLVPEGTKPLPVPMLTYHPQDPVLFSRKQFRANAQDISHLNIIKVSQGQ